MMGIIDKIIWCGIGIIVVAIIVFALWMCFCIARREDEIAEKRWKEYNEKGERDTTPKPIYYGKAVEE